MSALVPPAALNLAMWWVAIASSVEIRIGSQTNSFSNSLSDLRSRVRAV